MSYYQFNRQEILQIAKERHSKEKAAEYYLEYKEAIKKIQKFNTKTCRKKKKTRLRSTKEKSIKKCFSIKKKCYKKISFLSIKRMSEKTLKFVHIRANKKEFHKSNQPIDLMSVNTEYIVTSDKALNILLVTKKAKLLNCCVLSYLK